MRRLRAGEWLAGGGGAALLVALLGDRAARRPAGVRDVMLLLLALVPLGLAVTQATRRSPAVPVMFSVLTPLAGMVAALVNAVRPAGGRLGLAASLVVVVGGWRSLRAEHVPGATPPPVESRPAPPPGPAGLA